MRKFRRKLNKMNLSIDTKFVSQLLGIIFNDKHDIFVVQVPIYKLPAKCDKRLFLRIVEECCRWRCFSPVNVVISFYCNEGCCITH